MNQSFDAKNGFRPSWPMLCAFCALLFATAFAQQPGQKAEEDTRGLWNMQFEQARAKANKPKVAGKSQNKPPAITPAPGAPPAAKPAASAQPKPPAPPSAPEVTENDLIGITLWRLRQADPSKRGVEDRLLIQQEFIPERTEADAKFNKGQRLRLSIEIPRTEKNYLYVIDREIYTDGTTSAPYMIFPSTTINGGQGTVQAGKITNLPAITDASPFFTLASDTQKYAGEQLTIIVSPQELPLPISQGAPLLLNSEQTALLQQWEKDKDQTAERREAKDKIGLKWTETEKAAGDGSRLLVQDDPLPQTIYRVKAQPDGKLLLVVPLRVAP